MNLESNTPQPKRTALASTKADLRELRGNSQATVKELQQFLRELKGKSPHEMLGLVTSSSLFKSLLLSILLVISGILLFTLIPYLIADGEAPVGNEPAASEVAPAPLAPVEAAPESAGEDTRDPTAAETLGIGEELHAPTTVNPLENSSDDFLEELE